MTRGPSGTGHRRALALLAVAAVVVRLGFALGYWNGKPLTHDEQEYLVLALNLAADRGFTPSLPGALEGPRVQHFSRAPFYPWILSLVFRATNQPTDRLPSEVPTAVKVVQSLAGAGTVLIVGALAFQAGGPLAATAAATVAALHPPLVWIGAYALTEALYTPLLLVALWLVGTPPPERRGRLVVAGLALGAAALMRPGALAILPCLVAWLAWRARLAGALLIAVVTMATIAPWTVRNYLTYGRPILIAAEGGVTFWTGNHPEAIGEGDLAANPHLKLRQQTLLAAHATLAPEEMEPIYYQEALRFIRTDPFAWAWLCVRKLFYTFAPWGPSYRLHSALYFWASVIPYTVLFAGALLAWTTRGVPWPPEALIVAALATIATNLLFFPQERFRIPVLDPTYITSAALWWTVRRHQSDSTLGLTAGAGAH